jgi:putative nucleotidyltransferase with HDIG domain
VVSAYLFGRRHAILTAFGSILIVTLVGFSNPAILASQLPVDPVLGRVIELVCWGAPLLVAASLVGRMYEHRAAQMNELRETYHGVVVILRHFVANDSYTENHCYRVSHYAVRIATEMGLSSTEVEDLRAAALLHDIGKLKVSRDLLHKAARLTEDEYAEVKRHVEHGMSIMEPAGGALRRILPLVLSHHDRYDGQGYTPHRADAIPLGARILAVADAYDAMTSDRPYRKAVLPLDAKEVIEKGVGTEFDPAVVAAFVRLFRAGQLELTSVVV